MPTLLDVFKAPAALFRMDRRSLAWAGLYLALASGILFGFAAWIEAHQDDIRQLALDYLFPSDWHFAAGYVVDTFFAQQAKVVLAGVILGGGLALVSMLLFPVKEQLSAVYETHHNLIDRPTEEHPLWLQALEEAKLFLLYVTIQMVVLRIGYTDQAFRVRLAVVVNFLYLATTFGIDFLAPVLQRHKLRYNTILKVLLKHPLITLLFGALYAAPALIASKLIPHDDLGTWMYGMFAVQVVAIVWACVAGTWLGAKLYPHAVETSPPSAAARGVGWAALLTVFALNAHWFGSVGAAIHHKSQLLKCDYDVQWSSVRLERPSLGAMLLAGKVQIGVALDMRVTNDTAYDLVVEDNRLEVRHDGTLVSESAIQPFAVPAGESADVPMTFTISLDPKSLVKGRELLEDHYKLTWFVEVADGVEVPIYLRK